jgi:hypothetical protein
MQTEVFDYIRLNYWHMLSPTAEQARIFRKYQDVRSFLNILEFVGNDVLSEKDMQSLKEDRNIEIGDIETYTEALYWQTVEAHVQRIYEEKNEALFFLSCPLCGALARTPYAKQARCGHRWG